MKSTPLSLLILILIAGTAQVLVACNPKRDQPPVLAAPAAGPASGPALPGSSSPGSVRPSVAGHSAGGSDSGGCNGVGNKCYDSYIIDPAKLPAYQSRLKGIWENIKPEKSAEKSAEKSGENPARSGPEAFFLLKTWYLAPVELEAIDKDSLGVSFLKTESQQIARQSMNSVWINKTLFDKMSVDDQAELILHEMVMTLYFLRFMKMDEICDFAFLNAKTGGSVETCKKFAIGYDEANPPEAPRKLTEKDNENIRFITGWLLQNARDPKKPVQSKEFDRLLAFRGFDRRFFRGDDSDRNGNRIPDLSVSGDDLYNAFQAASAAHDLPDTCMLGDSGMNQGCQLTFARKQIEFGPASFPGMAIKVELPDGSKLEMNLTLPTTATLTPNRGEKGMDIIYAFLDSRTQYRIGDLVYHGFVVFRRSNDYDKGGLIFHSLILRSGVIASIDPARDPVCQTRPINPKTFAEHNIVVHKAGVAMDSIERLFNQVPVMTACTKDNVAK